MSLSQEPALSLLQTKFVCGWRNIKDEPYCGISGKHDLGNPAVKTTNGAGPHNIQLFMLAPDGTVLNCLTGYWDPRDLARELAFAEELNRVWTDPSLSRIKKDKKFAALHSAYPAAHPTVNRSEMQGFDKKFEVKTRKESSDCIEREGTPGGRVHFKTTDEIVHERMAERPFVPYSKFDVAEFSDYGRPKYDKRQDGGEGQFVPPGHAKVRKSRMPVLSAILTGLKSQKEGMY